MFEPFVRINSVNGLATGAGADRSTRGTKVFHSWSCPDIRSWAASGALLSRVCRSKTDIAPVSIGSTDKSVKWMRCCNCCVQVAPPSVAVLNMA